MSNCAEIIRENLAGRIADLKKLWEAYNSEIEEDPELGHFCDYGIAFDYVPRGTFEGQELGYFRYQLSWGGPGDEFRYFVGYNGKDIHSIEYWYLDWWDGAKIVLEGTEFALLAEIWYWFLETGVVETVYLQAKEDEV